MMRLFTEEYTPKISNKTMLVADSVLKEPSRVSKKRSQMKTNLVEDLYQEKASQQTQELRQSRVLFVTNNQCILEKNSSEQTHLCDLSDVFEEIHIIVLGRQSQRTLKIAPKVWVYTTASKDFEKQTDDALRIAHEQLRFNSGFRPDVIVALDPFESGVAAHQIAQKYKRAFQVHILEDFYTDTFVKEDTYNSHRAQCAKFVIQNAPSIRVATTILKQRIESKFKHAQDVSLLPQTITIESITKATSDKPVPASPFDFTLLFVGSLDEESTLFGIFEVLHSLLKNSHIGLIVIGEGVCQNNLRKCAHTLGIDTQVLFLSDSTDVIGYMKNADIFLCVEVNRESESTVLQAAATGLPIVMAGTPLREELFTHESDALLFDPAYLDDFSRKLISCIQDAQLRTDFSEKSQEMIRARIEEDPYMYRLAYRDTIEEVFT